MRNMLQLLGGVAVAGVVAAGTTAFTASGFSKDSVFAQVTGGGAASFTVNGANAKLMSAALINDATESDQITGTKISMMQTNGTTPIPDASATKIKVKFTGATGSGTATWGACIADSGTADDGGFTCAVPGGYYETISSVQIAYIP